MCPQASPLRPLRVLIVEDYIDCPETKAWLLLQQGFDVEIAPSGEDALALADAQDRDVVLLDIGLPGMSGWDVARCLKAREATKKPYIIALTGYGQNADHHRSVDAGVDLHLTKPIDPTVLEQILCRFQQAISD